MTQVAPWDPTTSTVRIAVTVPAASFNVSFTVFGTVSTASWAASVDPPALYSPFFWISATYSITTSGQTTVLSVCLRANSVLPPGTAVTIRNLNGTAVAKSGPVAVYAGSSSLPNSFLSPFGTLDAASRSLVVSVVQATYAVSLSVTLVGQLSAPFATAEAAPRGLNLALYDNVTITTTRMQLATGCSLTEGVQDTLSDVSLVGSRRLLLWTPTVEQAGQTYRVCMRLISSQFSTTGATSLLRCFNFKVGADRPRAGVGAAIRAAAWADVGNGSTGTQ